jgi:hypothetical protein
LKIVCLIAVLIGIATAPGFAAEARHREIPGGAHAGNPAVRKPIPRRNPAAGRLPVVRNSIGRPVARPEIPSPIGAQHAGPALPGKSINPVAPVGPSVIFNRPAWPKPLAAGVPQIGAQVQHPLGSRSFASSGRIDGAALIRPQLAPSALGGQAKMSGGINGTNFHPKH